MELCAGVGAGSPFRVRGAHVASNEHEAGASTSHRALDFRILGRQGMAGLLMIVADTAEATVNRRDSVAIHKIDDLSGSIHGRSAHGHHS